MGSGSITIDWFETILPITTLCQMCDWVYANMISYRVTSNVHMCLYTNHTARITFNGIYHCQSNRLNSPTKTADPISNRSRIEGKKIISFNNNNNTQRKKKKKNVDHHASYYIHTFIQLNSEMIVKFLIIMIQEILNREKEKERSKQEEQKEKESERK